MGHFFLDTLYGLHRPGSEREQTLKVGSLKVPSKVDLGQKKRKKMHILGFCVKKPKYRVLGRFFWPKSTFEGTFREPTFKVCSKLKAF